MQKYPFVLTMISAIIILLIYFIFQPHLQKEKDSNDEELTAADSVFVIEEIRREYGLPIDSFNIIRGNIRRNQNLSVLLSEFNVNRGIIHQIAEFSREIFDVRRIRAGNPWALFLSPDSLGIPKYFVYEETPVEYILVSLSDPVNIERNRKEVKSVTKEGTGTISSSLWNAAMENNMPPMIAILLSEIFAWNIDFFGLQRGDYFRIIYEEEYVEDFSAGAQRIKAAYFNHAGRDFYAIPFEQDSVLSFFDTDGNSLRRAFLKAPIRYSRISSRFSHSRMHPVLRIRRPHYGVDYAAPVGTPVYAIGDGKVIETSYNPGAGRMVRIRHNSVYTSAYLHLRNFGPGIKPDVWVSQGDVIGYVGSSGMSTGPHLDFRIWRNGQPVDPLRIESPPVEPVREENLEAFNRDKELWMERLNRLNIKYE